MADRRAKQASAAFCHLLLLPFASDLESCTSTQTTIVKKQNGIPTHSQFDPFVEQSPVVELAEQTRLGNGVGRITHLATTAADVAKVIVALLAQDGRTAHQRNGLLVLQSGRRLNLSTNGQRRTRKRQRFISLPWRIANTRGTKT